MKKAFTLVEILVVVTIISLLASIAAVSYSQFMKQSRDARRKADVEQIRAAIELYRSFNINNAYPSPIPAPATSGMSFGVVGSQIKDGSTIYMNTIPNDPMASGLGYSYYYSSVAPYQDYTLCTYVEGSGVDAGVTCGAKNCNYCMGPYGQK